MTENSKTIEGFAWNHLSKLIEYGLTYILGVMIAKILGANQYSVYVTLLSLVSFCTIIGGLGLDETLNKYVGRYASLLKINGHHELVQGLIKYRLAALIAIGILLTVFRIPISKLFDSPVVSDYLIIVAPYVVFQSLNNFLANFYIAQLKTKIVFIINSTNKILTLFISILLLLNGYEIEFVFYLLLLMSVLSFLTYYAVSRIKLFPSHNTDVKLREPFKFGLFIWLNMILTFMSGRNSNVLLLSSIIGTTAITGYYEIAHSLTQLIEYVFAVGFTGVALAAFSELAVTEKEKLKNLRCSITKYLQFFIIPAGLFVLSNASDVIIFIYSAEYLPATKLLLVFLSLNILGVAVLGGGANTALLFSIGKEKNVLVLRLITGLLNVGLNILIIPTYGAMGAITVTGSFLLLSVIVEFWLATKYTGLKYDFYFLLKILSTTLLGILIIYILNSWIMIAVPFRFIIFTMLILSGYYFTGIFKLLPLELFSDVLKKFIAVFSSLLNKKNE